MLLAGQFVFIFNFFRTMFFTKASVMEANPWQVSTLEWATTSPPPYHNFDVIPTVVRGPHEFSDPVVLERLGRDWIGQAEALPELAPALKAGA